MIHEKMKCFVCGDDLEYFLTKTEIRGGIDKNTYVKCESCGLVISQTIYEMTPKQWKVLNDCHYTAFETDIIGYDPQWLPRITRQCEILIDLFIAEVFPCTFQCVDYGCGDGKLVDLFNEKYPFEKPKLFKYEKYLKEFIHEDYLKTEQLMAKKWDLVITCSVLEHLRGKEEIDEIIDLLADDGVFALHTLICEEVPCDPEWFYLESPHCTFYTNKAMSILFEDYGFTGCAYHVEARMWFFFKNRNIMQCLKDKQHELGGTWVFGEGFVDYWKVKPYRS